MFYEVDMASEFIQSVINSCKNIKNKENITVDLNFNISEYFEKIDTTLTTKKELIDKFYKLTDNLLSEGVNLKHTVYEESEPRTMVEYRRDLNYFGCRDHDYVIWGETDCLIPEQTFEVLDSLMSYAHTNGIFNFVTTFSTRKMWDDSWKILEHIDFENKPFHSMKTEPELAVSKPYSIRYTMSIEEMNQINNKTDQPQLQIIDYPKFDGSCLIISSNLIKLGANIPPGFFGLSAEDTAFMYSCQQIVGKNYRQFVIKNLLKVHNRNHPEKRKYTVSSTQDKKGDWYDSLRDLNKENLQLILSQGKVKSYKDWKFYES